MVLVIKRDHMACAQSTSYGHRQTLMDAKVMLVRRGLPKMRITAVEVSKPIGPCSACETAEDSF